MWKQTKGAQAVQDNCDEPWLTEDCALWVHNWVRLELKAAWKRFVAASTTITGWGSEASRTFRGKGGKSGAILAKLLCYPSEDGSPNNGTLRLESVLTALLTSMPAQTHLARLTEHNLRLARVLRETVGPTIVNPPHHIAVAMHLAAVTRRQAEALINAIVGPVFGPPRATHRAALLDLSKERIEGAFFNTKRCGTKRLLPPRREMQKERELGNDALDELCGPQATGTNGAHVDPMRAVPLAVDLMPGSVNVLTRLAQLSAAYRRACLLVASALRRRFACFQQDSPPVHVDTDLDPDHHVHLRLSSELRDIVVKATGYSTADWTRRSWSLSLPQHAFAAVLAAVGGEAAPLPAHLAHALWIGTVPHGSDSLLLHQLDRMLAELCELASLPQHVFQLLSSGVPQDGGVDYLAQDPFAFHGLH